MVKLLYGVCGEGLGHASRSRILISYLKKHHDIHIAAGGKAYTLLSKEFEKVTKIESARFAYTNNQAALLKTILWMGYRTVVGTIPSFFTLCRLIKTYRPDVVITDADPISNYAAGCMNNIKRISIDNPQVLHHRSYHVEAQQFFAWFTLAVATKIGMYGADKYLIYDFFDEPAKDRRVVFLKPLIQEGIRKQNPQYKNHVFVYQTAGATQQFVDVLKRCDESFIIYGCNREAVDGNLVYKQFNEEDFYRDIAHAKAVITNGGFTVISEALYLKKPVLSLPIRNQFEQVLNGMFVEKLNVGKSYMTLDDEKLTMFFAHSEDFRHQLQLYNPGNQQDILKRIEHEILTLASDSFCC